MTTPFPADARGKKIQFPGSPQSLAIETVLRGVSPRHEDREKGTFNRFVRKAEQGHTKLKRQGRGHDPPMTKSERKRETRPNSGHCGVTSMLLE